MRTRQRHPVPSPTSTRPGWLPWLTLLFVGFATALNALWGLSGPAGPSPSRSAPSDDRHEELLARIDALERRLRVIERKPARLAPAVRERPRAPAPVASSVGPGPRAQR